MPAIFTVSVPVITVEGDGTIGSMFYVSARVTNIGDVTGTVMVRTHIIKPGGIDDVITMFNINLDPAQWYDANSGWSSDVIGACQGCVEVIFAGGSEINCSAFTVLPPKGTLKVDTVPVSGYIYVDGVLAGKGSISLSLAPGTYTVSFGAVAGYSTPAPQFAAVYSNLATNIIGTYTIIMGTLECYAFYPKDVEVTASVSIFGIGIYTTPFTVSLNPGTYGLDATFDSKRQTKYAVIKSGETTKIDFDFTEINWLLFMIPIGILAMRKREG